MEAQRLVRGPTGATASSTALQRWATWRSFAMGWETGVPFVTHLGGKMAAMVDNGQAPDTILNYASRVSVAHRRLCARGLVDPIPPAEASDLADAREIVRRLRPYHSTRQAVPATWTQVRAAAGPLGRSARSLMIVLMWLLAARHSDLSRVQRRDLRLQGNVVVVRYRLTKSSQTGAVRSVATLLPDREALALAAHMSRLAPTDLVFTSSWDVIDRALKKVCHALTPHSLRRGAVTRMLDAGMLPADVRLLTGHRSDDSLLKYAERIPAAHAEVMIRSSSVLRQECPR